VKAIITLLLAAVLVLAWQFETELEADRKQAAEIRELRSKLETALDTDRKQTAEAQELRAKLADKSKRDNLDLQAKCAAQAEKVFHQLGWREDRPTNDTFASYQSHYNAARDKCFMTLATAGFTNGRGTDYRSLFDAYEQRDYAEYQWISDPTTIPSEVPPTLCKLTASLNDYRLCRSEEEYNAFVAHYME